MAGVKWMDSWKQPPSFLLLLLLVAVSYAGADVMLNTFAIGAGWTILWPLNGVTIALLLRTPRRRWLWLLLAIEISTACGEHLDGNAWGYELFARLCSIVEVVLCAVLLPSFVSMEGWLGERRIVPRVVASLLLGPGVSGVFYAFGLQMVSGANFGSTWNHWATPDMLGCVVTLPVVLMLRTPEMRGLFGRARLVTTLTVLAASTAMAVVIFTFHAYPLLFLFYPMLLCVDWKLSFAGASIAVLLSSIVGVYCTMQGLGPFGHWPAALALSREAALQLFIGFHAVALLPFSLVMLERKNITLQLGEANARLELLTRLDALTGIANRRAFDEAFGEAWDRCADQKQPLSLLMLDIDYFKQFNDRHGHLGGDACLIRVAALLRTALSKGLVARFGGEEFIVLLPGMDTRETLQTGECLRCAIVRAVIPHEDSAWGVVTLSVGCSTILPTPDGDRRTLLAEADHALYMAKERGRNRVLSPLTQKEDVREPIHPLLLPQTLPEPLFQAVLRPSLV